MIIGNDKSQLISVLNQLVYEFNNNGGGNLIEELVNREDVWFFHQQFISTLFEVKVLMNSLGLKNLVGYIEAHEYLRKRMPVDRSVDADNQHIFDYITKVTNEFDAISDANQIENWDELVTRLNF